MVRYATFGINNLLNYAGKGINNSYKLLNMKILSCCFDYQINGPDCRKPRNLFYSLNIIKNENYGKFVNHLNQYYTLLY